MKRYVQQKFEIDGKFIFFSFMAESFQLFCIWLQGLNSQRVTIVFSFCWWEIQTVLLLLQQNAFPSGGVGRIDGLLLFKYLVEIQEPECSSASVQWAPWSHRRRSPQRVWCNPFLSSFVCLAFGMTFSFSLSTFLQHHNARSCFKYLK